MGSAGQRPLMAFAWHGLNRLLYRRLLLIGLLGCVCAFPVWANERPTPKSVWRQSFLLSPSISCRRRGGLGCSEIGRSPSTYHCFKF